jgi:Domain of unknown function (DUF4126)
MTLALDICQAAGLGAACGISPFLPVLVAGGLARAKLGVDFDHTPYAFLQDPWFLLAIAVAFVATVLTRGYWVGTRGDALATVGIVLGGLEGAGTLADHHHAAGIGWVVGAACALLAALAVRDLLARVRARLDAKAAGALPLYAYGASLVVAIVAIALPPLSLVVVGFLAWLLIGGRRRAGEKFAGLRSLR